MDKNEPLLNPFPVTGYHGPDYFCDREKECKQLIAAVKNGRNVNLVARRRIGKTSLLHHFTHIISNSRPSWRVIYLDLMQTTSLRGLYELISKSIFLEKKKSKSLPDLSILGRLKMSIGVDPITQLPQATFDLKEGQVTQSFQFLLDWISQQNRIILVFDEFQQVLSYKENAEPFLRSEMQRLGNVRFIFSGSDQHLLQDMFNNSRRPFYQSTESMTLLPIEEEIYIDFIRNKFDRKGIKLSNESLEFLLSITEGETFAVQRLCNALYEMGYMQITIPLVQQTLLRVLEQQQSNYERVRGLLNPQSNLFKVLRSIAKIGVVTETYGKEIIEVSKIHNTSSINKAIKSLYGYGVINQMITEKGNLGYIVDDVLFKLWLNRLPED